MIDLSENISWPGWKVGPVLGKGSVGTVYEIERDVFGRTEKAALKTISIPQSEGDVEELLNDGYDAEGITQRYDSYLREIVNEYSLMAELRGHSHIVDCDDLRYTKHKDGYGWDIAIKMELLTSVNKALSGEITEQETIQLGMDICKALVICKKKNVVHRDIKPQNIFVSPLGQYKLGDFGIAKIADHTTAGTKTGTYKYMAPEVYNGLPYGSAADIYSLGIVLYWMLNERRTPFLPLPPKVPTAQIEEKAKLRRFRGDAFPAPAHGSEELKRIVMKACAYKPEDRYPDPAEMLEDLTRLSRRGEERSEAEGQTPSGEQNGLRLGLVYLPADGVPGTVSLEDALRKGLLRIITDLPQTQTSAQTDSPPAKEPEPIKKREPAEKRTPVKKPEPAPAEASSADEAPIADDDLTIRKKSRRIPRSLKMKLVAQNAPTAFEIAITKPEFFIGKKDTNDGVISYNRLISRVHCKVLREGQQFLLCDLDSTNNTFVNGVRLTAFEPVPLQDGDEIRLANSAFQVVIE